MGKLNSRNDAIGYKRPPANSRFVKGKSGNPKGRPKGKRGGNTLADLINQPVTVTVDGARRQVPMGEALTLSLFQRALTGNVPAAREVMKILEKVEAEQKVEEYSNVQFYLAGLERKDCNEALETLDVLEPAGDRWCIRPWVIEAALARNSQLLLNESDRRFIEVNMLNPGMLDAIWPNAA